MFFNTQINFLLRAGLVLGAVLAVYYAQFQPEAFSLKFATEDGPIEYATAVLLLVASGVLLALALKVEGYKRWLIGFYALLFFAAAGEEISWGQRIFGIESGEFFEENNYQGEINFHNLVIRGTHLTEIIFGTGLALLIMVYLAVLPFMFHAFEWVRRLTGTLCVPVPQRHIAALAVLATLLSAWISLDRQWEVYEFSFGILICLIFLNPVNREAFGLGSDR